MSDSARPRLCPVCKTLVGINASRCHNCGANLRFSLAVLSRSLGGLLPTESPITWCILTINIILFVLSAMASVQQGSELGLFGGLSGEVLLRLGSSMPLPLLLNSPIEGQWWRLVTACFLHGGILHFAMNTWILMDVGPVVEELYGSARYLFVYILTGAAGFLVSAWANQSAVGASGALMGLIGVMIAVSSRRGGAYMREIRARLIRWILYIFLFGFIVTGIDNYAHFGGLATGFLLGRLFSDQEPATPQERRLAQALGWSTGVVTLVCLGLMLRFYFQSAG